MTADFIEEKLGYNLSEIDPQAAFFRPSSEIGKTLGLIGNRYDKSRDDVERMTSAIDSSDIGNATENNRCGCFREFCEELTTY